MKKSGNKLKLSSMASSSRMVQNSIKPHNSDDPAKEVTGQNLALLSTQLLKDLVIIIKLQKAPYIRTRDLIASLCADPVKPWASYFRGSNITARQLSGLLKPYGLSSCCIYYKDGNAKGYLKKAVTEAYRRIVKT